MEHIKWNRNCIEFSQKKTGNHIQLPLQDNLKFAIIDYIKNSRPASSNYHIFLRHMAPFEPFVNGNKLCGCINKYINSSGIAINGRKHELKSVRIPVISRVHDIRHAFSVHTLMTGWQRTIDGISIVLCQPYLHILVTGTLKLLKNT